MADPYFSICIPQYSRTSFLMQACERLAEQSWKDFEICISDDCSPDQRQTELQTFLKKLGLRFVFQQQQKNLRYDGNLRAALSLASGKFCLLMGNDDQLAHVHVLRNLHRA